MSHSGNLDMFRFPVILYYAEGIDPEISPSNLSNQFDAILNDFWKLMIYFIQSAFFKQKASTVPGVLVVRHPALDVAERDVPVLLDLFLNEAFPLDVI